MKKLCVVFSVLILTLACQSNQLQGVQQKEMANQGPINSTSLTAPEKPSVAHSIICYPDYHTGILKVDASSGKGYFHEDRIVRFQDLWSGWLHYPVFGFKKPLESKPFAKLALDLHLASATQNDCREFLCEGHMKVSHVLVQRIVGSFVPGHYYESTSWVRLEYKLVGNQFELSCEAHNCRGEVPADIFIQLQKDTKPGEQFGMMVVGFDLADGERNREYGQVLEFSSAHLPNPSFAIFSW